MMNRAVSGVPSFLYSFKFVLLRLASISFAGRMLPLLSNLINSSDQPHSHSLPFLLHGFPPPPALATSCPPMPHSLLRDHHSIATLIVSPQHPLPHPHPIPPPPHPILIRPDTRAVTEHRCTRREGVRLYTAVFCRIHN